MILNDDIVIDRRFCGPPTSGNGGYVCGVMARFIDGPAEVTLRRPPPLEQPLVIERVPPGTLLLRDGESIVAGENIVAEARPVRFDLDVPAPPAYEEALEAARRYSGFEHHPFPTCFVCGPERAERDGLRIFAGLLEGTTVAAPWVPDVSLTGSGGGHVRSEFLWAALDCPGYFAVADGRNRSMLLGRMTAQIVGRVRPGERCVVLGWPISGEGRKHYAGTALFSDTGRLLGQARSTWIEVARD